MEVNSTQGNIDGMFFPCFIYFFMLLKYIIVLKTTNHLVLINHTSNHCFLSLLSHTTFILPSSFFRYHCLTLFPLLSHVFLLTQLQYFLSSFLLLTFSLDTRSPIEKELVNTLVSSSKYHFLDQLEFGFLLPVSVP